MDNNTQSDVLDTIAKTPARESLVHKRAEVMAFIDNSTNNIAKQESAVKSVFSDIQKGINDSADFINSLSAPFQAAKNLAKAIESTEITVPGGKITGRGSTTTVGGAVDKVSGNSNSKKRKKKKKGANLNSRRRGVGGIQTRESGQ